MCYDTEADQTLSTQMLAYFLVELPSNNVQAESLGSKGGGLRPGEVY